MPTLSEKYAEALLTGTLNVVYEQLVLQDYEELVELPPIPSGITKILLAGFPHLRTLPQLPVGVREVDIACCQELEFDPLDDILPPTVERLSLLTTRKVKYLPLLPSSLRCLICDNTGLEVLASLPLGLESVSIGYSSLERIPCLPDTVGYVSILG
jgi:hypothetical protein